MAKVTPISVAPGATKPKAAGSAVTLKRANNVISIQAALQAQMESNSAKTEPPGGSQIRMTQDKKFMLPNGVKTAGPLELVVIDFNSQYKFWEGAYDKDSIKPVACFAIGDNPRAMAPSPNSPIKQATSCQVCPMNMYKSDTNGKGKACKNSRVMVVMPPDGDEDTPLWLLATSPTATKDFDSFVEGVKRVFQLPPVGVIVTVGFDDSETYAKLTFSDPKPNPNIGAHFARMEEARAMLLVEPDVSKFEHAAPTKKAAGARR